MEGFELDMKDHKDIEDALPDFALGILDDAASKRIAGHLAQCNPCRDKLRDYEEVVGHLGLGAQRVTPRDTLKFELMNRIGSGTPAREAFRNSKPQLRAWWHHLRLFSPAMATACMVLAIMLATVNVAQWRQSESIRHRLSSPMGIFKMRGSQLAPHADGTFVIGQDRLHGVLVASDLPKISEKMQYHLWLLKEDESVSIGAFKTTPAGYGVVEVKALETFSEYRKIVVTMEPAEGSPAPSGPEVMVGFLQ